MGSGSRFASTVTLLAAAWLPAVRPSAAQTEAGTSSEAVMADLAASVHRDMACGACHGEEGMPADAERACGACHAAEASAHASGRHSARSPARPSCVTCHGSHRVLAVADPESSAHFARVPGTCAPCHEREAVQYARSVHAPGVVGGRNPHGATCTSCHEAHATGSKRDASAWSSPAHLARTCGACHPRAASAYAGSAHDRAMAALDPDAPTCATCHGAHEVLAVADAFSPVAQLRSATATCARCHAAVRLEGRHIGRVDVVGDFAASFHGLALAAGDRRAANCASCHGAHAVRAASDLESSVHPDNLDRTCGTCHPGAIEGFARGGVHHVPSSGGHRIADGVRWLYLMMIPMVVGGMVVHDVLDFRRRWRKRQGRAALPEPPDGRVEHVRFTRLERAQHWTLAASFVLLAASGFALVFARAPFGVDPVAWERARALVHRSAAGVFLAVVAFHVGWVVSSRRGRAFLRDMVPKLRGPKDLLCRLACCFRLGPPSSNDWRDLVQVLRAGLGLPHDRPRSGRFTYAEKMEYLALAWGAAVMAITGFLLWFEVPVLNRLPYWTIHVATTVHYFEAVLAVLAIVAWHFYFTMFNPDVFPVSRVMFSGRMSHEEMVREHPTAPESLAGDATSGPRGDEGAPGSATTTEER